MFCNMKYIHSSPAGLSPGSDGSRGVFKDIVCIVLHCVTYIIPICELMAVKKIWSLRSACEEVGNGVEDSLISAFLFV